MSNNKKASHLYCKETQCKCPAADAFAQALYDWSEGRSTSCAYLENLIVVLRGGDAKMQQIAETIRPLAEETDGEQRAASLKLIALATKGR